MTDDRKDALHAIVAELLGLSGNRVVWANQIMPRPKRPFATMQVISELRESGEDLKPTEPGKYDVIVPVSAVVSVQYYGCGAMARLDALVRGLERPTIVDRCAAAGLAAYDDAGVSDTSMALDGERWEERATADLRIRYSNVVADAPGYIDTVVIDGGAGNPFAVDGKDKG